MTASSGVGPDDIIRAFEAANWLTGTWVPDVVRVLSHGPERFEALGRAVNSTPYPDRWWALRPSQGLGNCQLTRTLRAMERDGLLVRHEDRSRERAAVSYSLSGLMLSFLTDPAPGIVAWVRRHDRELEVVRRRHRQERNGQ